MIETMFLHFGKETIVLKSWSLIIRYYRFVYPSLQNFKTSIRSILLLWSFNRLISTIYSELVVTLDVLFSSISFLLFINFDSWPLPVSERLTLLLHTSVLLSSLRSRLLIRIFGFLRMYSSDYVCISSDYVCKFLLKFMYFLPIFHTFWWSGYGLSWGVQPFNWH